MGAEWTGEPVADAPRCVVCREPLEATTQIGEMVRHKWLCSEACERAHQVARRLAGTKDLTIHAKMPRYAYLKPKSRGEFVGPW